MTTQKNWREIQVHDHILMVAKDKPFVSVHWLIESIMASDNPIAGPNIRISLNKLINGGYVKELPKKHYEVISRPEPIVMLSDDDRKLAAEHCTKYRAMKGINKTRMAVILGCQIGQVGYVETQNLTAPAKLILRVLDLDMISGADTGNVEKITVEVPFGRGQIIKDMALALMSMGVVKDDNII